MPIVNLDETPDTPPTTGPGTAPKRTPAIGKLETQLQDFYTQLGTYIAVMSPDPFIGVAVQSNADGLSTAWADLAAQDRRVKDALERILSGGAWAAVVGGHVVGIALPVLAYYGRLPEQMSQMLLGAMLAQHQQEGGNPMMVHLLAQRMGVQPTE